MSSAAARIASLDARLAEEGQTVTLRRTSSGTTVDVDVLAKVTTTSGDATLGDRAVMMRKIVLSPSGLGTWPGALAQSDGTDTKVPRKNDAVIIAGRLHMLDEHARGVYVGDTLVRIEISVQG